jgi:hypothetical protein
MRVIGATRPPGAAPIRSTRIEIQGTQFNASGEYQFVTNPPIGKVISHRMEIGGQGKLQNLNINHTLVTGFVPYTWTVQLELIDPDQLYTLEIHYTV